MGLELVFNSVIKLSIMASILAVLILLLKYALRNKLDAKWQYAIWILLIIRLLIPYDIQSPLSIYSLLSNNPVTIPIVNQIRMPDINAQIRNISRNDIQLTNNNSIINKETNSNLEEPISQDLSYGRILAIIWLVGVLVLGILTIAINLRFYSKIRRDPHVTDVRMSKLMKECTSKLGIRKILPIIITNRIEAPCLYGIFSPKLLLSKSLVNRLNEENIRHIFLHELFHYKRKDILINWLAVAVQIAHWFNPLIWYSFAKMREDCELACDADTLNFLSPEEYQSYGLSIISLATHTQTPWLPGATGFFGNENNYQIKRRIKMIKLFQKPTLKWTCIAVVIFISLGLMGFTNSISNSNPKTGASTPIQTNQSDQSYTLEDGSFNYQKYLSFTPLLPSYTAGYKLTHTEINCDNGHIYWAQYGDYPDSGFSIFEALPNAINLFNTESPKTQIQIGDFLATASEEKIDKISSNRIKFTKNNVEYTVMNNGGAAVSIDELKKICESLVVPVKTPPTDTFIVERGLTVSDELSYKTIQPGDLVVPKGYKFIYKDSNIHIEGDETSETCSLAYGTDYSPILHVTMKNGGSKPMLTPNSDFYTKQINGTEVKLRKTQNVSLPAAQFTIKNGLQFVITHPDLQENEVEKVVTSILQAYTKL
ncbi:M56 family metallopeptidase [Desulfosporosinus lacus]|uniref:BlaR1 peptidase M56 n=1 Tax=Desulfosporosinus lacus DSM 15449 TaxID=1121420 RepID=A0A1M5SE36_9FIRM|nr:M56 family metallopeptidase [Desulfosporosinus lacus]SHH36731.1 BlaR1 peptidase M56 [Desulfosporosinus lacus DSM 15449]